MSFLPDDALPEVPDEVRQFLDALGNRTDFPSFAANVASIAGVSLDLDAQIVRLQQAIVQDVSLTAKVLQIANGVALGGGSGTITSVRQAILLLGFERVRHLALAATVFEQLHRRTPVVRELMALSLINANQSYQLALQTGYAKAELAYLGGMFQNIGEVLVATYRARDYARWLGSMARRANAVPGTERRAFGVGFDEIGAAVAQGWRMPRELVNAIRASVSTTPTAIGTPSLDGIVRLSAALTNAIYRFETAAHPATLPTLLARHARPLGLDEVTVRETVEIALTDSTATLGAVNATVDRLRLAAQIETATAALREIERRAGAPDVVLQPAIDDELALAMHAPEDGAPEGTREERTRAALRALDRSRESGGEQFEIGRVSRAALEAICGAGYRRAVLALSSEDFSRVRGRLGAGDGHERAVREFLVRLTTGASSLATALGERTDVFTDADAWTGFRRDALLRSLAPRSFGLLPLVHGDRLLGCLYFDDTEATVDASEELRGLLSGVRDQLVNAFAEDRRRRAAA